MIYPTSRAVFFVAIGVPVALLFGVAAPDLWLAGIAWIVLSVGILVVDALAAGMPSSLRIVAELPGMLAMGQSARATFHLTFDAARAPRQAEAALDAGARLQILPSRRSVQFVHGRGAAEFPVTPLRRGEGRIEKLWVRWTSPLGFHWVQKSETIGRSIPVVPNVQAVKDEALRLFRRDGPLGLLVQLSGGESAEFHALRDFQTGMDRRAIDWKQSAKHAVLRAKEFHAEQNQHLVLVLDTGRLMSEPLDGQPRLDRALHAILLMAYVALKLGDRVGLFAFDEKPRLKSGTVAGARAFPLLQRLATGLDYSTAETNFTLGLTQLASDIERRSIIVIFTDFVDTTSAELMLENVGRLLRRHLVLFVAFRDQETETLRRAEPKTPEDVARAVIADALLREREIVIERLRRLGTEIIDAPAGRIGMRLLNAYIATKRLGLV
jgi:uncharacterized protein (DUF58 family)